MRISILRAGSRAPALALDDAEGLVAVVTDGEPLWDQLTATLADAYGSRGRFTHPGPVAQAAGGLVRVGTGAFEARLAEVLKSRSLHRDEYAALWFGAGPPATWLSAAWALMEPPGPVRELRELGRETKMSGDAVIAWQGLLRAARDDIERLAGAEDQVQRIEVRLGEARQEEEAAARRVTERRRVWEREQQEARTRLALHRERSRELRQRMDDMGEAESDRECSACARPLGDALSRVQETHREDWESVVQDGRWWRRRSDQLKDKPAELQHLESRGRALASEVEELEEALLERRCRERERFQAKAYLGRLMDAGPLLAPGGEADPGAVDEHEDLARAASEARERVRLRVHAGVVALTGGRLISAFPTLYREWSEGERRGGEDVAVLELAVRITLAELAQRRGLTPGTLVLPSGLDRLRGDDMRRAVAELGRLASTCAHILVRASPEVVAAGPEQFRMFFRLDGQSGSKARIRRGHLGMGRLRLTL